MTLQQYLNNPEDYATGEALYDAHFGAGRWERKMDRVITLRIRHKNLVYQLRKLHDKGVRISVQPVQVIQTKPQINHTPVEITEPAAPVLEAPVAYPPGAEGKEMEARNIYRAIGRRRTDLYSEDRSVRAAAALYITENMKKNRKLWDDISYFQQHGKFPEADDSRIVIKVEDKTVPELVALAKNLPPWISKERKKILQEKDPAKKKQREDHLAAQVKVLEQVKKKLNG